jgi:hypothetical protein
LEALETFFAIRMFIILIKDYLVPVVIGVFLPELS